MIAEFLTILCAGTTGVYLFNRARHYNKLENSRTTIHREVERVTISPEAREKYEKILQHPPVYVVDSDGEIIKSEDPDHPLH